MAVGLAAAFLCGRQISGALGEVALQALSLKTFGVIPPIRTRISEVDAVTQAIATASEDLRRQDEQRRETEGQLLKESRKLEELNRVGLSLVSELDQDLLIQKITDATVVLSGAAFGTFFYIVRSEGDGYLRKLLVVGITAVMRMARKDPRRQPWLAQLLERKLVKIATVGLANKTARIA